MPPVLGQPLNAEAQAARHKAQEKYIDFIKKEKRAAPMLLGRFIARQIAVETAKMSGLTKQESDFTDAEGSAYLLADHIERLRYLELKPSEEERQVLVDVLQTALPGLEQFVKEGHATLLGKITYNAFGVCFGDGRDDRVSISSLFRVNLADLSNIPPLRPYPQSDQRMSREHVRHLAPLGKSARHSTPFLPTSRTLAIRTLIPHSTPVLLNSALLPAAISRKVMNLPLPMSM